MDNYRVSDGCMRCHHGPLFAQQDPREALIVSLRREVEALQNENDHLRNALDINKTSSTSVSSKCASKPFILFFFFQV